jgi:hypothetical protein
MPPRHQHLPSASGAATAPSRGTDIDPIPAELKALVAGSKISALAFSGADMSPPDPPATRILPSGSGAAAAPKRETDIEPVGLNLAVAGSKISALAEPPPATRTLPSGSGAAAGSERGTDIEPVGWKVLVAGSKISALPPRWLSPPTTSTRPSGSGAATTPDRWTDIEPVRLKPPDPAALACGASPSARKHRSDSRSGVRRRPRQAIATPVMVLPPDISSAFVQQR